MSDSAKGKTASQLIDAQMRTEARMNEGFAELTEAQANMDVKFAELAQAQATTQRNLDALINVVRKDRQEREDRGREG